jgi:formylglycine-generating enzyme required for sulfatase activity
MRYSLMLVIIWLASIGFAPAEAQQARPPGTVFKDCPQCPEMVVVAPGSFTMGELGHTRRTPLHPVTIGYTFVAGRYDVTFDEWDACVAGGGCAGYRPDDHGWGRGRRPVINVSWDNAQDYVAWLGKTTGKHYRLISEAEFEYVARAGTATTFWWGDAVGQGNADCAGCGSKWDDEQTAPVGSFKPNAFGIYDTAGNVTQWVEDRWNSTYHGAPQDGSAWETGDTLRRVMRSGSWHNNAATQHSSFRNADSPRVRNQKIGFRIAVTL